MSGHIELPKITLFLTYLQYLIILFFAYSDDFISKIRIYFTGDDGYFTTPAGYATLLKDWEYFWTRRIYSRIRDCWDRAIASAPGSRIEVLERVSNDHNQTFQYTGKTINCLNLGSYNYLGFADGSCNKDVISALDRYGLSTCSSRDDFGHTEIHQQLEETVARFLHKESAVVFGMGFNTNSTCLPNLVGKGGLIISDSLNHCSLIVGCRASGAKIKVFRHNDYDHLEQLIRDSIAEGQPRTHRPWTKILIVVEGIYSMEGEIVDLPRVVAIKKKYKAYLYLDEAHSIGALGSKGGGVCDLTGVDTKDVDIMMGTFTKSFGAVGGYIAGSKDLISFIRRTSFSSLYDTHLTAPCAQQILSTLRVISGEDGTTEGAKRIKALKDNSNFFRTELKKRGFFILGSENSPVIPILIVEPAKIAFFSRSCLQRGIAVVVVGFPATELIMSRCRVCISAAHTHEDLEKAIEVFDQVGNLALLKYHDEKVFHF